MLALRVISLPLEIGLCILGIRFILRNKVDVPKWDKPTTKGEKKDKKNKKKKKNKGKGSPEAEGDETDERADEDENIEIIDQDTADDHAVKGETINSDGENKDDKEAKGSKGCFLCCCCRGGGKRNKGKGDAKKGEDGSPDNRGANAGAATQSAGGSPLVPGEAQVAADNYSI